MTPPLPRLEAFGVPGIGEVAAGDDVAALLLSALGAAGQELADGDVVVVSSKVLSKAEGRSRAADSRDGAIAEETVRVVAERITPRGTARIVQARSGPVLAAAGVDASNVTPGTVLTLPADPDASARTLLAALRERTGCRVGVIVADTLGRPWRQGQTDSAIGAAGVAVVDDLRGGTDAYGNPLEVTVRALADELAGLADLVKGKLTRIPVAVVRGLGALVRDDPGPGAAGLLRPADQDWFRYGHVEAVRAALGVPPGEGPVPPRPVEPGGTRERVDRALAVVRACVDGLPGPAPRIEVERGNGDGAAGRDCDRAGAAGRNDRNGAGDRAGLNVLLCSGAPDESDPAGLVALGMTVQRLLTAAWAEDLEAALAPGPLEVNPATVRIRVRARGNG